MKSLNELTGQRPECKRDPPLSADSCSCAPAVPACFTPNCPIYARVNALTGFAFIMHHRKQRRCGAGVSARRR